MIFVPRGYKHMVLNLWPSAAVNQEFAREAWLNDYDGEDNEETEEVEGAGEYHHQQVRSGGSQDL